MSRVRRYRPVDCAMRADARFRALSAPQPNAQSLWVHLITCGHDRSIPGLLCVGLGLLSEDLGWSVEDVRRCLAEIEAQGMVEVDPVARVIWLPKAVAPGRNEPRSPSNVVAMGTREWLEVPECSLKWRAWRAFAAYLAERGEDFLRELFRTMPARDEDRLYAESLIKSARPKVDPKARPKARPKAPPSKKEGPPPRQGPTPSSSSSSSSQIRADRSPAEPAPSCPPAISGYLCSDGSTWDLSQALFDSLVELHAGDGFDVRAELLQAKAYIAGLAQRNRYKPSGMPAFLRGALKRAATFAARRNGGAASAPSATRPPQGRDFTGSAHEMPVQGVLRIAAPTAKYLARASDEPQEHRA